MSNAVSAPLVSNWISAPEALLNAEPWSAAISPPLAGVGSGRRLLAVASERFELSPWLARCQSPSPMPSALPYAMTARWNDATLCAVANGPGPRLALQALEAAGPFDALLSIGLCGALAPGMALNTICTATDVGDGYSHWPALPIPGATPARLLSVDRFLGSPAEKRAFHEQGFDIVDMEAASLARYAEERRIPFYAVKVVSDEVHEQFKLDFNACRDEAGRFRRSQIALSFVLHPFRYGPDVFRLASRGPAASEILGVFLAHVRI